jgi:dihydroorotate dehydrogenase
MKIPLVRTICMNIFSVNDTYEFLGLTFKNRVGLAAGLDKNAEYLSELEALGFGFIEIGTVTPKAQAGNDLPRLFRLKQDECLINRMGFNNDGVEVVVQRLKNRPKGLIVGGNIGKNKVTPNELAVEDYAICFDKLYPVVDYFVVNVSSPNTPNLRELQDKKPLLEILNRLNVQRKNKVNEGELQKPILLKIAPDLTNSQIDDVVEIVKESGIDGLVATNTTISRSGLITPADEVASIGSGGLSGKVLQSRSTEVVTYIAQKSKGSIPIIGVGGIHNEASALEKTNAGASLVQVYTGFVYGGPPFIKKIAKAILNNKPK